MIHPGSCHCGAVRFEVEAPATIVCKDCNCSICRKSGNLHLIVPKSRFKLVAGQDRLSVYTFNTGIAQHYFCSTCGVKPFYIPRSNPDDVDVNARCLDEPPEKIVVEPFDGQNWEEHADTLRQLSVD